MSQFPETNFKVIRHLSFGDIGNSEDRHAVLTSRIAAAIRNLHTGKWNGVLRYPEGPIVWGPEGPIFRGPNSPRIR